MQNCYKSGSKTKGKNLKCDDQDERLTTKHIHTLQFLQETVNENKLLKAQVEEYEARLSKCEELHHLAETSQTRIKEIQTQYLQRADEINRTLMEKHRAEMMQRVDSHVEAEKAWSEERRQFMLEIERLKKANATLRGELEAFKKNGDQREGLETRLQESQEEIAQLKQQRDELQRSNSNQLREVQRLQSAESLNQRLTEELKELQQQKKELEFRLSRAENPSKSSHQEDVLSTLTKKLSKILEDKTAIEVQSKEKIRQMEVMETDNSHLRKALEDSERMRGELREKVAALTQEISMLRHQISTVDRDRQSFKDFVQLKRDFTNLLAENTELKSRLKVRYSGSSSLPLLKDAQITAVKSTSLKDNGRRSSKDSSSPNH